MTKICFNLKEKILPVVCNPSPEGYLPDTDEIYPESHQLYTTQMVVVNAWRSIKEMAYLLAEIIKQSVKVEDTIKMLNENLMIEVGEFFITIFTRCKHRGVFEQAYVGFTDICEAFRS